MNSEVGMRKGENLIADLGFRIEREWNQNVIYHGKTRRDTGTGTRKLGIIRIRKSEGIEFGSRNAEGGNWNDKKG